MVRWGGSVFSAALRQAGEWALIYGSGEASMPNPPEEWWLDDVLAKEMGLDMGAIGAKTQENEKVVRKFSRPRPR